MKPYYDDGTCAIYHGDAFDLLPRLESVDLVLTDPPYNVGKDYGTHDDKMTPEVYCEWCRAWFQECRRLSKSAVVVTPALVNLPMWMADVERTHFVIAWTKQNNCSRNYIGPTSGFQTWEPVLVYGKSKKTILRDSIEIAVSQQPEAAGHPCPKPIKLWRWLAEQFTHPGDLILDPFMGSGTTLRAAKDLGRKAIGIEIEERYCEIAARRLGQEVLAL